MYSLTDKLSTAFTSDEGKAIFQTVSATVNKYAMRKSFEGGVAVGFSAGADSVLLLSYLYELKKSTGAYFPLIAIHVNHLIRGECAYRDAAVAKELCDALGIELITVTVDVPALARAQHLGIEEAARNARYSAFEALLQGRNDIKSVALAHNATDNVETVIINMARGAGVRGMCGIPPVRDYVIRPLIDIPKSQISAFLDKFEIPYVTDETNFSDEYTRNSIRNNILPHLAAISPSYERSVRRMTENMRSAYSLIESISGEVLNQILDSEAFSVDLLRGLHPAVFADVLSKLCYSRLGAYPEEGHITAISECLLRDNFSVSLCGGDFVCQRGVCFFKKNIKNNNSDVIFPLNVGENIIHGTNAVVFVEIGHQFKDFSSNIYKFSISVTLRGDIISDGLCLRFKRDGDSYRYGGITHKLKKVFNDRGIPPFLRQSVPIICDKEGILWVPGLSLRDGAKPTSDDVAKITVCFKNDGEHRLYAATPFCENT